MENYTVYILYSKAHDTYYIGQTNELQQRLKRHNSGFVPSTKPFIPWILVCRLDKPTRVKAMELEKKLKDLNRQRLLSFIVKYGSGPVSDDSDF